MSTIAAIEAIGVVPVITIDDAAQAVDLAHALTAGGIPCAEITLRTEAGLAAIAAIAAALPDFQIGAGTVLTPSQVEETVDAGARFIVSPGFDDEVVDRARELGALPVPGVATASEVQRALRAGVDHLKLFPAGALGGRMMIDALAAPFPQVRFLPSGGVTALNAAQYLSSSAVFAVSGSWMASRAMIAAGDWDEITRLSAAFSVTAP
jgi:2-dehydro-3-deoxyphosphogluconate aldolase / (4S)-4-hydroxy-2-oxoglutarate aldolase